MIIVAMLTVVLACLWCLFPATRTVPVPPAPAGCSRASFADADAVRMAAALEGMCDQLLRHLSARYPQHPTTRDLLQRWNRRVLPTREFSSPNVKASFNKSTGCLYARLDETRSVEQWLGIVLHELAHASGTSHDEEFRRAWKFLLNVATRELGWNVVLHCRTACSSYLLCAPQDCELCACSSQF
jgi:hypothetical protein